MRKAQLRLRPILLALVLTAACGTSKPDYPEIDLDLRPETAKILSGTTVKIWVTVLHSGDQRVTWSLSGTGCSGGSCGTITSDGLYTAPASVPGLLVVTARATANADPSKSAIATITVVQPGTVEWTWISGSDLRFAPGDFGTKGVPVPSNAPPARNSSVRWLGLGDTLWLFGGECRTETDGDAIRNDLWRFDPATREWTWMSGSSATEQPGLYGTKGVSSATNVPGARIFAASGAGLGGDLWLFGGGGYDSAGRYGDLNDLWKFDQTTGEWTWVSGSDFRDSPGIYGTKGVPSPSDVPGARNSAAAWSDAAGHFWIFGGSGWDSEGHAFLLNDLWEFDPATQEWTWVSGSNIIAHPGQYGARNVPAPTNVPGARRSGAAAVGPNGHFWLFGGKGYASGPAPDYLNDLWEFDPAASLWTWISGSDSVDPPANYGTQWLPLPSNAPAGRTQAVVWLDAAGVLWLFGGDGSDSVSHMGVLNDLWKFDTVNPDWVWVSGSESVNQIGIYGTLGQSDPLNIPGARASSLSWLDSQGRYWLFGGGGMDSTIEAGYLNDLWLFDQEPWVAPRTQHR
jgi:N-acetylneuraminic acid mutarotase